MNPRLLVVAGLVQRDGLWLVTDRPPGSWMAGYWEFPGGKVEPDEDPRSALTRELEEELGIGVEVGNVVETLFHSYPDRTVLLLFYSCQLKRGEPVGNEGQRVRWVTLEEMQTLTFLPADEPLVKWLWKESGNLPNQLL